MNVSPFKAIYPKVDLITSPKSFFSNIKYHYREYRKNGVYSTSDEVGYYIYQIKSKGSKHLGILTLTEVKEMNRNNILKHEKTLAAKEQQMMHLLLQRSALVKPVLLGFKSNKTLNSIIQKTSKTKPLVVIEFEEDAEVHTIWPILDKKTVAQVTQGFTKIKKAYIGDGHHRSTTVQILSKSKELGAENKRFENLYTAYFPFEQLKICDYNRVVDISDIISLPEFIVGLSKYFEISILETPQKPKKKHHLTFFIDSKWYKLKWKEKYIKVNKKNEVLLDSALINKYVFGEILGIEDVRVDTRINYYGGTQPLTKIENSSHKRGCGIGICIFPVSVKELTAIADKKQTLPPKSTWFLPRLKSGIIAKDL